MKQTREEMGNGQGKIPVAPIAGETPKEWVTRNGQLEACNPWVDNLAGWTEEAITFFGGGYPRVGSFEVMDMRKARSAILQGNGDPGWNYAYMQKGLKVWEYLKPWWDGGQKALFPKSMRKSIEESKIAVMVLKERATPPPRPNKGPGMEALVRELEKKMAIREDSTPTAPEYDPAVIQQKEEIGCPGCENRYGTKKKESGPYEINPIAKFQLDAQGRTIGTEYTQINMKQKEEIKRALRQEKGEDPIQWIQRLWLDGHEATYLTGNEMKQLGGITVDVSITHCLRFLTTDAAWIIPVKNVTDWISEAMRRAYPQPELFEKIWSKKWMTAEEGVNQALKLGLRHSLWDARNGPNAAYQHPYPGPEETTLTLADVEKLAAAGPPTMAFPIASEVKAGWTVQEFMEFLQHCGRFNMVALGRTDNGYQICTVEDLEWNNDEECPTMPVMATKKGENGFKNPPRRPGPKKNPPRQARNPRYDSGNQRRNQTERAKIWFALKDAGYDMGELDGVTFYQLRKVWLGLKEKKPRPTGWKQLKAR